MINLESRSRLNAMPCEPSIRPLRLLNHPRHMGKPIPPALVPKPSALAESSKHSGVLGAWTAYKLVCRIHDDSPRKPASAFSFPSLLVFLFSFHLENNQENQNFCFSKIRFFSLTATPTVLPRMANNCCPAFC